MIPLLYDCDNTLGIHDRDVDDGLALLYLIGRKDVDLLGTTTTFGNGSVDEVYNATKDLLGEQDIPLLKGASSPENRQSNAACFLVESAQKNPGDNIILATGPLSNLYEAHRLDPDFFTRIKELVIMGGTTEPLVINGNELAELNFSADPEACYHVLSSGCSTTVITGNLCLHALLTKDAFESFAAHGGFSQSPGVRKAVFDWIRYNERLFSLRGFHIWDAVAALCVTDPYLFADKTCRISSSEKDFQNGRLVLSKNGENLPENVYTLNIPDGIIDETLFWKVLFDGWAAIQ